MSEAKIKNKNATGKGLNPADFVHLHVHTHHSLLDGLQKIPQVVQKVKLRE
jgi:hypothetical protein